jgi:hypothetical protein
LLTSESPAAKVCCHATIATAAKYAAAHKMLFVVMGRSTEIPPKPKALTLKWQ